jgi:hypothetical protein
MHASAPLALALVLATLPAPAQEATPPEARRVFVDAQFHAAAPAGDLREGVRGHLGLGFGLGLHARIAPRLFMRARLEETGFRVRGDSSVLAVVADGMGAHYDGDREIIRNWRAGVDLQAFLGAASSRGPFVAGGISMQWAEYRYEWDRAEGGEDDRSGSRVLARRTAPSWTCAAGWQWAGGGYLEARAASVEYSSPDRTAVIGPRKGWILMLAGGIRL